MYNVAVWRHSLPTPEFLYLITNQAIDAIKVVVHTVNMKLRKLKKSNVKSLTKLKQDTLIRASAPSSQTDNQVVMHVHVLCIVYRRSP